MKINQVAALSLVLLLTTLSFAQKVDTLEVNGERYFVYPFKVSVHAHNEYFSAVKINDMIDFTLEHYGNEIRKQYGEDFSEKDFKKLAKRFRPGRYGRASRSLRLKKAIRKNPYPLLEQGYSTGKDIVPALDPIPDGKYVQLFEDFCLMDSKGRCQPNVERIAAYFTIKNNTLEGDAVWLNMKGDTLKYGKFEGGLKVGEWVILEKKISYSLSKKQIDKYIKEGAPGSDTIRMYYTYVNGAKNGPYKKYNNSAYPIEEGMYMDDEKAGEWIFREVQYKGFGKYRKRNRNNEQITLRYTLVDKSDTLVTKKPWIRNGLVRTYTADFLEYNFLSRYSRLSPPRDLFEINFHKEIDLDLEEEHFGSYEMDVYDEEMYYEEEYGYDYEYGDDYYNDRSYYDNSFKTTVYDKSRKDYFDRSYVIDSIGLIAQYTSVYEAFYPNGQRAFRYEFKEGELQQEDTLFWDNGVAHDVILFVPDSNHFLRSIYDYDGKLFKEIFYDSIGEFIRVGYSTDEREFAYLEGYKAYKNEYGQFYSYDAYDTLEYELTEPVVLFRSWFEKDSSRLYNTEYDPVTRTSRGADVAVTGLMNENYERTFSEDYSSWTGVDTVRLGDMMLVTVSSGALYEGEFFRDTIPQRNVGKSYNRFDVAEDHVLYRSGVEYTGPVEIKFNTRNFKFNKKDVDIKLPRYRYSQDRRYERKIEKYKKKGKGKNDVLLNYMDVADYDASIGSNIYYDFFQGMFDGFFYYPDTYDDYYYRNSGDVVSLKGYMLDGKPHGVWVSYRSNGKAIQEVPFEKGLVHGLVKTYRYAYPRKKDYFYSYESSLLRDTAPPRKTYYLSAVQEFKNGLADGKLTNYNWLKEVKAESNYKDGMRNGPAFERNRLAYTRLNYEDDMRDGYLQTYLTIPGKDSVLLYDLNFQNGMLTGESKSYHMNGNLSKRGFFLDGEPLDDYEAFDSLGFRYHYVKFQYSYPVEEKIWEENQLSVRYLFDWQDSIEFVPTDITTSQSLERVLYDLGIGREYIQKPYYGRPTLVKKKGVKYHMTKYYPNDTIARDGDLDNGKKIGCWKHYNYDGEFLYEVDYFDTILVLNDSIKFHAKGIYTEVDSLGNTLYKSYVIEKFEKYDCSHTDHYEIRQFYTISEAHDSIGRMNGYVKNYYDNGVLQSEGQMKDGLPVGFWKIYDPFGKLNQYGQYVLGKRDGRWLSGDLSKTKYLGDICLNPSLPDLEKEIEYRENLLDIVITNYRLGKALNKQFYDINMNRFKDVEEDEESESTMPEEEIEEE